MGESWVFPTDTNIDSQRISTKDTLYIKYRTELKIVSDQNMYTVYLPYSYNSVGNKNEENDKRFNKSCDCPLSFFKPRQCLQDRDTDDHFSTSKSHLHGCTMCYIDVLTNNMNTLTVETCVHQQATALKALK